MSSTTPSIPKIIAVKFSGSTINDPVIIRNLTTGDIVNTHPTGELLRVKGKDRVVFYQLDNLPSGWSVGDKIAFSIGGSKAGTEIVTLTADTNAPQQSTNTTATVSTVPVLI